MLVKRLGLKNNLKIGFQIDWHTLDYHERKWCLEAEDLEFWNIPFFLCFLYIYSD